MSTSPRRILLVDDDTDMHHAVRTILEAADYAFEACQTAGDALARMRHDPPDLVLLDIMLAHPTEGYELALDMRSEARLSAIRIVFVSAIGQSVSREACPPSLHDVPLVEKPFDAATLRAAVERALGG